MTSNDILLLRFKKTCFGRSFFYLCLRSGCFSLSSVNGICCEPGVEQAFRPAVKVWKVAGFSP
jgi:hypothetical protein